MQAGHEPLNTICAGQSAPDRAADAGGGAQPAGEVATPSESAQATFGPGS